MVRVNVLLRLTMNIDSLVTVRSDKILLNLSRLNQGFTAIRIIFWRALHVVLKLVLV